MEGKKMGRPMRYHPLGLVEIARQTGLSPATVSRFFRNKEVCNYLTVITLEKFLKNLENK